MISCLFKSVKGRLKNAKKLKQRDLNPISCDFKMIIVCGSTRHVKLARYFFNA